MKFFIISSKKLKLSRDNLSLYINTYNYELSEQLFGKDCKRI